MRKGKALFLREQHEQCQRSKKQLSISQSEVCPEFLQRIEQEVAKQEVTEIGRGQIMKNCVESAVGYKSKCDLFEA